MKTVLVIEDERALADLISSHLEKEGYRAVAAYDGISGLKEALHEIPDLVILDLMLPGMPGTEVCSTIRRDSRTAGVPVIIVTARGEEIDRVIGFESGADDYVVKPFSPRELMLRVNVVLKRSKPNPRPPQPIVNGSLAIDPDRCIVTVQEREVVLTTIEFKLLLTLAERLGRVQSREFLLKNVWSCEYSGDSRTVDTHMTRVRAKLGEAGELIKTVRGFGYKMEAAQESSHLEHPPHAHNG